MMSACRKSHHHGPSPLSITTSHQLSNVDTNAGIETHTTADSSPRSSPINSSINFGIGFSRIRCHFYCSLLDLYLLIMKWKQASKVLLDSTRVAFARTAESGASATCRCLSSNPQHLKRPPTRHVQQTRPRLNKWRTHAVNLVGGDYSSGPLEAEAPKTASTYDWQSEEMELSNEVKILQKEIDVEKEKWIQNSLPKHRETTVDALGRSYGRGARKTASARVWIEPGDGLVVVNNQDFVDYFDRSSDRDLVLAPLAATRTCGRFDVVASVAGGGLTGQAGAIRHGLARALDQYNPTSYRPPLKRLGFLTRDPRKVERKKVGHLKARKKPQWVKR